MTHEEQRKFLIRHLLAELPRYSGLHLREDMELEPGKAHPEDMGLEPGGIAVPWDEEEQRHMLRSLMNIRPPMPVSPEFLAVQDEYLREEVRRKGIVDADTLPSSPRNKRLVLWKGDITTLRVDGIVNAANSALRGCFIPCHSCVDNRIHSVSGIQLRLACDEIMKRQGHDEPVGMAKITPAFNLPCRHVLHTVGPIVCGPLTEEHCSRLADCYRACLALASEKGLKSIAFSCISTGEFRFPQPQAARIAVRTAEEFLEHDTRLERVVFNVFKEEDLGLYRRILEQG